MKQPDPLSRRSAQASASFLEIPSNRTPNEKNLIERQIC
jgi:hypothetical protein